MSLPPSIFNDVLGPVMRGPSSSHSAAANRIARIARNLVGERVCQLIANYDPNGSLVTTHKDQGTDLGLYSGILGWQPDDARLPTYPQALAQAGIEVVVNYVSYDAPHPNYYRLELIGESGSAYHIDATSTGGGMIELQSIDGVPFGGVGDLHTTVYWMDHRPDAGVYEGTRIHAGAEMSRWLPGSDGGGLLRFDSREIPPADEVEKLGQALGSTRHRVLHAVLPILSRKDLSVPFTRCGEMQQHPEFLDRPLWESAASYEAARGGISPDEVLDRMKSLAEIMSDAVADGLKGTEYGDRILPAQSPGFTQAENEGRLIPADINNRIIRYVSALMEMKSSMGVIVAAPTAGSCGAMPGAVLAVADALGVDEDERARALLIAGLIGVFITRDASFAAEEGGCMAECGSGSSMAAAAIVHLAGGSTEKQLAAASMALQNCFGLVCDPIANRVEAPCLGKNVMAATNALSCANMALADYQHLIPFDEVVVAMNKVAHQIPRELRCTNLGGLSITPTADKIAQRLAGGGCGCSSSAESCG
ncbi:MAG: L-serine ammonia-lyase, iron-sulfur-dependent, subunit alpha [Verrucomicrobiae bacterium]|nr:L-serine ammonia-lyase, iron-sulfur-dependent, subunit alpha [Verrucomicrobiae bacterium]NNJ42581.1 serine dehydratase [Akkermansiaceae bacterium]